MDNTVIIIFLIILSIVLIAVVLKTGDYLKKLINVYHFTDEVKYKAIAKKLNITDKELNDALEEFKKNMSPKDLTWIEKEHSDLWG